MWELWLRRGAALLAGLLIVPATAGASPCGCRGNAVLFDRGLATPQVCSFIAGHLQTYNIAQGVPPNQQVVLYHCFCVRGQYSAECRTSTETYIDQDPDDEYEGGHEYHVNDDSDCGWEGSSCEDISCASE